MSILVTNDDGVHAPGLAALAQAVSRRHEVVVVAPEVEQSAVGHAITLADPIKVRPLTRAEGLPGHAVKGTPSDCVKLAVWELLPERPTLVISGINRGSNTGFNILYSGTVSAATEAALLGLTGLAFSLDSFDHAADYSAAAALAAELVDLVLAKALRPGLILNVNFPLRRGLGLADCRLARQGLTQMHETFLGRRDPRGNLYYWQAGEAVVAPNNQGGQWPTDQEVLGQGLVSITPLQFDLTNHQALPALNLF